MILHLQYRDYEIFWMAKVLLESKEWERLILSLLEMHAHRSSLKIVRWNQWRYAPVANPRWQSKVASLQNRVFRWEITGPLYALSSFMIIV